MSNGKKNKLAPQERQMRFLSQSIRLKESASPGIVRATLWISSLTILAFIGWAAAAEVNEVARSPGEIIPSGHHQVVQHLEGGTVQAILVRDGDRVEKGQVLMRLDGSDLREDLSRAKGRAMVLDLQEERLRAFIEGRAPDFGPLAVRHPGLALDSAAYFSSMQAATASEKAVLTEQIRQKKQSIDVLSAEARAARQNLAIVADLLRKRQSLHDQGLLSGVKLLETQQRHNEIKGNIDSLNSQIALARAAVGEYETRGASLGASQMDEAHGRLEAVLGEQVQNDDLIAKLEKRVARLDITAPVTGIVKGLGVNTVGSVIQPGQVLMEVIPSGEALVVSLKIPPRYIGHIAPGQPVQVKFSSYDFARYGAVAGTLQSISATTFSGEDGERFYEGKVALASAHVGASAQNRILPGMTVMADIVTGEKTVLQYLLKPIQTAAATAFTEK